MMTKFLCKKCGQEIIVHDFNPGQLCRCNNCGEKNHVPEPTAIEESATRKCPYCAEEVLREAKKCKHCGSIIDDANAGEVKASKHPQYIAMTILGLLLPIIGVLVGIVFLTKDSKIDKKLGEHMIAWSLVIMIIFGAIYIWFIR